MADLTGPLGGDSGGKDLEAAAKRQLAKAEGEVRQAEKTVTDVEAAEKRLATKRADLAKRYRVVTRAKGGFELRDFGVAPEIGARVPSTGIYKSEGSANTRLYELLERETLAENAAITKALREQQGRRAGAERLASSRARRRAPAATAPMTEAEVAKVRSTIADQERRASLDAAAKAGPLPNQSWRDWQRSPNARIGMVTGSGALNQRWEREFRAALAAGVKFTPSEALPADHPLRGLLADAGQAAPPPPPPKAAYQPDAQRARKTAAEREAAWNEEMDRRQAAEAQAVEQNEQKKTTAVEKGTQKRSRAKKAEGDVTKKAGGDLDDFNRILGGREGELQRQVAEAERYRARAAAGGAPAPGSAAYKAEVARQEAALRAQEEIRGRALIVHPTARLHGPEDDPAARRAYPLRDRESYAAGYVPGTRSRLEAADRQVAQARVASAASQTALTAATRRAAAATGAEAAAATKEVEDLTRKHVANQTALAASREQAAGIRRENAARFAAAQPVPPAPYQPGTDIIRHPTLYGQRQPGPFGQVFGPRDPNAEIEKGLSRRQIARDPRQQSAAAAARDVAAAERVAAGVEEQRVQNLTTIAHAEATAADRSRLLSNAVRYESGVLGGLNGDMRRHGALTTEFIQAAARGEASYREWGFQIGATAAKFGAWTLVSIPVIAALDAVRNLGEGAVASASGVHVLQRSIDNVDATRAQQSFRELSKQFNLPISDVVEAVYRSSQVFHLQADAVDAARAALYSYQVGEVSVQDSTRYLNAIATGAGLTGTGGGKQILDLFNQINQAQNRFGVNIRSTEAGMSRAAGAFTNAGGSLSYLLALITTGSRVTGRTGENIGTALQRSVGFIQRPTNRAKLREFGIDPTQGVQSVYEQAFEAAQHLHGPRLQQLATALSSPQYASYLVPILQNRQLFRRVQAQTSPQASQGSAEKELAKVLSQVDEQIKRLGTGLQQLGSNLAQSGVVSTLGLLLHTLNSTLSVVNGIFGVFNKLPGPIREALGYLVQARLVLAGVRRANLGEALVGGRADKLAPYLIESDDKRAKRIVGKGVRRAGVEIEDAAIAASAASQRAAVEAKALQTVETKEYARLDRLVAAGTLDAAAAEELKVAATERSLAAQQKYTDLSKLSAAKIEEAAVAQQLSASFQRDVIKGGTPADVWARDKGIYVPPVLDQPLTRNEKLRQHIIAGGDPAMLVDDAIAFQGRPPKRFGTDTLTGSSGAQSLRAVREMQQTAGSMAAASAAMSLSVDSAKAGWRRATIATGEMAIAARATALELAASLGPQGLLLAVLIGLPKLIEGIQQHLEHERTRVNRARGLTPGGDPYQPISRDTFRSSKQQLEEDLKGPKQSWFERLNPLAPAPVDVTALTRKQLAERQDRFRRQQQAIRTGQPVPELTPEGLKQRIDRDFDEFDKGQITLRQLRERQATRLAEIKSSLTRPETAQVIRSQYLTQLLQRLQGPRPIADRLTEGGISTTSLDSTSEGLGALLQGNLATTSQRDKYLQIQLDQASRSLGATGPIGQKRYAEKSQAITEALQNIGKAELDRALGVATTQAQRDAAYSKYQRTLTLAAQVNQRALLQSYRRQRAAGRARDRQLTGPDSTIQQGRTLNVNPIPDLLGNLGSLSIQTQLQALTAQTPQLMAKLLQGRVQAQHAARAMGRVQKALRDAMKPILDEIRNAQRQSDATEGVQEAAALIQAQTQLSAARAGSQVGAQQAQLSGLGRLLAFQRAHRGTYKPSDIVSTEAQLADAQHQLGLTMQQQARDLIAAQAEYQKSLTDNPVKQAQIDARAAQRQLAYGHFETPAARLQAQAERNRTRRDAYKAASDRQIENLDLQHDIGKLSDQAYISALKRIERTTKAGAEYKRQLHARILRLQHDVQNDSDLDLNVGNLRLPTVYDVRRLARQGLNSPVVNQTNNYTIPVRSDGDLERLGGELRSIHGSNVVGALRSAGLR